MLATIEEVDRDFQAVRQQVQSFADDMATELEKPFSERAPDVAESFTRRALALKQTVTMLVHGATHARAVAMRNAPDDGPERLRINQIGHATQDISSRAMSWRARIDPVTRCFVNQIEGHSVPLYGPEPEPDDPIETVLFLMDRAQVALDYAANPLDQHEDAQTLGCFPDIRLKPSEFSAHALAAYRVTLAQGLFRRARFLDVGCGGGGKVLIASQVFQHADGLEFDPGYAQSARRLLEATEVENGDILEGNALEFEGYANYDVVYFFQPMRDTELLIKLEQRIASSVRPGTVLIAPYLQFRSRAEDLGCRRMDGHIYIAGATQTEVDDLQQEAERKGAKLGDKPKLGAWDDVWANVLNAFLANGFTLQSGTK
ncbi:class I SAM-dependent methyltransferase [Tropicimonas sp. S265A]|uniref:class I SAM-dependent methyltransferase n=1 Tax=Tropicimonas sp. S265A TaxID=3415134 RepID=UPI003C7D2E06